MPTSQNKNTVAGQANPRSPSATHPTGVPGIAPTTQNRAKMPTK